VTVISGGGLQRLKDIRNQTDKIDSSEEKATGWTLNPKAIVQTNYNTTGSERQNTCVVSLVGASGEIETYGKEGNRLQNTLRFVEVRSAPKFVPGNS